MKQQASIQKNMMFNTIGSLVYYFCQWLLSVVIVRISGYEVAGIFGLATTITASPAILALFNVRNYQVSDLDGQYETRTYISSRHFTNALAYVVCLGIIAVRGCSWDVVAVICVFMLYKLAEGTADVYYGVEQRWGRLDYAGISLSLRGFLTIIPFVIAQYLWNNLLLSLCLITLGSYAVVLIYDRGKVKKLVAIHQQAEAVASQGLRDIKNLLITCIPLAFVAFLNNLAFNFPKMSLEKYHGAEAMGYFASITSPALVVQLAANTIFAPLVTPLTDAFLRHDPKAFRDKIKLFAILMIGMSVVVLLGAALLGNWVLRLIFGAEIEAYTYLFVPSIAVTLCLAASTVLLSICTLVREIKKQYIVGGAGIIVAIALAKALVTPFGMEGVLWAQTGTIAIQVIILLVVILKKLRSTWDFGVS